MMQIVFRFLETVTSAVLILVMLSLLWMGFAAWKPEQAAEWMSVPEQVGVITGLLSAALILVSVVALLHTRPGNELD